MFPLVPGMETVGIVTAVGKNVTKLQPGDLAGIGPISEACMTCEASKRGDVQFCKNGNVLSCNMQRAHGKIPGNQENYTMGGFSGSNCLHQDFVVKVPNGLSLDEATAFMDVGLTVYDPLKHFARGRTGLKIGVLGVGGMGQMAILIARAMGYTAVAFSSQSDKEDLVHSLGGEFCNISDSKRRAT